MKDIHTPTIGAPYWGAITLASVFGTNLGDLYAHNSGLGIIGGLPILLALFVVIIRLEKIDSTRHHAYYWLAIIVIRTAATNIGDIMAGRNHMHIDRMLLTPVLAIVLAAMAWYGRPPKQTGVQNRSTQAIGTAMPPKTGLVYWLTMLVAGTLGTVFGDLCAHAAGSGAATILLGGALMMTLYAGRGGMLITFWYYWFALAIVRTFGTVAGDWLAENPQMHLGLVVSTIGTGVAFVVALFLRRQAHASNTTS